jgi:hypothetical protein
MNVSINTASLAATTTSLANARYRTRPAAGPWTTDTTGFMQSSTALITRCDPLEIAAKVLPG